MTIIKIDDDVPLEAFYNNGRPASYPFRQMKVGQSIFVPSEQATPKHAMKRAYAAGRRAGMKFTCRKQEDGVRIWRIQ